MLSQAVAPQVRSVALQAAVQQLPLPPMPHTPELQESFAVQTLPSARSCTQAPLEHQNPLAQSVATVQLVRQLVASAQARLPGHAMAPPTAQVPVALQVFPLIMPALHVAAPQVVPVG